MKKNIELISQYYAGFYFYSVKVEELLDNINTYKGIYKLKDGIENYWNPRSVVNSEEWNEDINTVDDIVRINVVSSAYRIDPSDIDTTSTEEIEIDDEDMEELIQAINEVRAYISENEDFKNVRVADYLGIVEEEDKDYFAK